VEGQTDARQQVEIVLTDEVLIFERREVHAELADDNLRQLNAEISNFAPETKAQWRRAITFSEPLDTLCGACGSRRCWCGVNRLTFRSDEARR
jgi:hypothetical protein